MGTSTGRAAKNEHCSKLEDLIVGLVGKPCHAAQHVAPISLYFLNNLAVPFFVASEMLLGIGLLCLGKSF